MPAGTSSVPDAGWVSFLVDLVENSKNRGPWFTCGFHQLPGPTIFPKRTPMGVDVDSGPSRSQTALTTTNTDINTSASTSTNNNSSTSTTRHANSKHNPGLPVAMFYVVDRFAAVYHGRGGLIIFFPPGAVCLCRILKLN